MRRCSSLPPPALLSVASLYGGECGEGKSATLSAVCLARASWLCDIKPVVCHVMLLRRKRSGGRAPSPRKPRIDPLVRSYQHLHPVSRKTSPSRQDGVEMDDKIRDKAEVCFVPMRLDKKFGVNSSPCRKKLVG